ncbi:MAG: hypothetical protein IPL60_00210 [Ardenticatenia bacterium]|nr:hypothetical protein [Ardenticatenia bacterium]
MRIRFATMAAVLCSAALSSLTLAAPAQRPAPADQEGTDQGIEIALSMVQADGVTPTRSYPGGSSSAQAKVSYSGAGNQKLVVRFIDFSGITVKRFETAALNGSGSQLVAVSVSDFVDAYKKEVETASALAMQNLVALQSSCAKVPAVPDPWPPRSPDNPYSIWLKETLTQLETARTSTASVTRTSQAMIAMAAGVNLPGLTSQLTTARNRAAALDGVLLEMGQKFQPPQPQVGSGTPTPPVVKPTPAEGCALMPAAQAHGLAAAEAWTAAQALVPTDLSGWQLPRSSAQVDAKGRFIGCLQYITDVSRVSGGSDSASLSYPWGVGDPGEPALVFPGPGEADATGLGLLSVAYGGGASSMYAQSVKVAGLNREATVSAYVTDASCLAIHGGSINFKVDPAGAATVSPASVPLSNGEAEAKLISGNDAADGKVSLTVGSGANQRTAQSNFRVIGPAKLIEVKGDPARVINRGALRVEDRRYPVSVFVTDANGQRVADGTMITFDVVKDPGEIVEPGLLAYDRVNIQTSERETVELGKTVDLPTYNGSNARFFPCEQGFSCEGIYLTSGKGPNGRFILRVTVDSMTKTEKFAVVNHPSIFMPQVLKIADVKATPSPRITTEPPRPTPRSFFRDGAGR